MSLNCSRQDALAFVYDAIHSQGPQGRQWLRSLSPTQVQDIAEIIMLWERIRRPMLDPMPHTEVLPVREIERREILKALETFGSVVKAARALGIGKTTMYRKLREYDIVFTKLGPGSVAAEQDERISTSAG